jgi:eukaryotic-like serine/threonine-protein kinase
MTPETPAAHCPACGKKLRPGRAEGLCAACLTKGWRQAQAESVETVPAPSLSGPAALFQIPGHDMMEELARGGMGIVYRARQHSPQRELAVKMLLPQVATAALRERFQNEARVMAALTHPAILPVHQYGEHMGVPWFSMPLCAATLAQRRDSFHGRWRGIAELLAGLAEAVAYAHAHGVLHRDIKPGNVLFDHEERALLADFGLAKMVYEDTQLTRSVSVIGTPHYLAPEILQSGANATTQSDVYALGAILYELLAEKPVFDAGSVAAILRRISEDEPEPLPNAVPRDLATIALKCLAKKPAERYASAQALLEDLQRWLRDEPITARRLSTPEKVWRWGRRRPALAAMTVMLAGTLIAASLMMVTKNRDLRDTLRTSLLNEARATRMAARVQGRHEALEAVKKAAALGSSPELEQEAASLLALASMRKIADLPSSTDAWKLIPDEDMQMAVDFRDPKLTRIVELPSMRELGRLPGGDAAYGGLRCFSPDGRLLFYEVDQQMVLTDWRSGEVLLGPLKERRHYPFFSPDGKKLAAGLDDGRVEIYDVQNPKSPPQIWPAGALKPAELLGYSPDGRWLALRSGRSHQVTIYGTDTGQPAMTFGDASDGVTHAGSWFGDSQGMMLGSHTGRVRSWIITSQTSRVLPAHSAQVYSMAVHPLGQIALSSGYDSRTWIIDWPSGRALGMEPGNSFMTRFSRDGTRAVLHDLGQSRLSLYDVAVSDACRQFTFHSTLAGYRPSKGSWSAEVSPDGRLLASAYFGSTSLYDVSTSRYLGILPEGGGNTQAWAADGELWIGAGKKLVTYRFQHQPDGLVIAQRGREFDLQGVGCMRLSLADQADRWAVSMVDGFCHGRMSGGDATHVPGPPEIPAQSSINPLSLSPDGRWVAASGEHIPKVGIYDLQTQRWVKFFDTGKLSYTWFTRDSRQMWLGTWDEHWVIDTTTWEIVKKWQDREEPGALGFIQGSADGRIIITLDGMTVVLRHGASGEPFLRLRHPVPMAAAWINLTPDARYLTYSALGHIQQVWDLSRLSEEMQQLGLPWRGPVMPAATPGIRVTGLKVPRS